MLFTALAMSWIIRGGGIKNESQRLRMFNVRIQMRVTACVSAPHESQNRSMQYTCISYSHTGDVSAITPWSPALCGNPARTLAHRLDTIGNDKKPMYISHMMCMSMPRIVLRQRRFILGCMQAHARTPRIASRQTQQEGDTLPRGCEYACT
jgi:hypothetical protein